MEKAGNELRIHRKSVRDERQSADRASYYETCYLQLSYFNLNAPLIAEARSYLRLQLPSASGRGRRDCHCDKEGQLIFFYGETKISKKVIASKSRRG